MVIYTTHEQKLQDELAFYIREARINGIKAWYYRHLNPDPKMEEHYVTAAMCALTNMQIQLAYMGGRNGH